MICVSVKRDYFVLPSPRRGGLYLMLEGFKGLTSGDIDADEFKPAFLKGPEEEEADDVVPF